MRYFNTTGSIRPEEHYFVPQRLDFSEVLGLIERSQYFVLHAPRQSGKTTSIEEIVRRLNEGEAYSALYINIEAAQAARDDVEKALIAILAEIKASLADQLQGEEATIAFIAKIIQNPQSVNLSTLVDVLEFWTKSAGKPRILFIDEIDSLIGDSLLSVLRQIRRGFGKRPESFPKSICLIGLRDVRDYRVWSKESGEFISTSSPFNIKAQSILLPNFSRDEVVNLYNQHTQETGQVFEQEAYDYAYFLTEGQPWLVNALAFEAVRDPKRPVTKEVIEQAKNILIKRRDTHLDSLLDKLREARVRPLIDAIIEGSVEAINFDSNSVQYVRDLGLIKQNSLEIANPIYREIIPRELIAVTAEGLAEKFVMRPGYIDKDGSLNMVTLLEAFTEFYRENSSIWLEKFDFKESGPHLLLMAFLQRIINGGGTIWREYALGRGRVDLLIQWQRQVFVLELKIKYCEKTLTQGLEQTAKYMDDKGATEGHLLIFDRSEKPWEEKISQKTFPFASKTIHVWTM